MRQKKLPISASFFWRDLPTQISLDRQLFWAFSRVADIGNFCSQATFWPDWSLGYPSNLVTYWIQKWSWGLLPAVHAIQQRCHGLTGERMLPSGCAISGITDSGQLHSPIAILYSSLPALGADLMHIHIGDIYSHTHTAQQAALLLGNRQVWAGTAARHSIDAMGHRKAGAAPPTKHSEQEKVLRTCVGAFNGTAMISHWNYNRITTLITCVSNMSLQFHLKPNLVSDRYWDRVIVVAARLQ